MSQNSNNNPLAVFVQENSWDKDLPELPNLSQTSTQTIKALDLDDQLKSEQIKFLQLKNRKLEGDLVETSMIERVLGDYSRTLNEGLEHICHSLPVKILKIIAHLNNEEARDQIQNKLHEEHEKLIYNCMRSVQSILSDESNHESETE